MYKKFFKSIIAASFYLLMPIEFINSKELSSSNITPVKALLNENLILLDDIEELILENNLELKSLKELVEASSYNLSSKLSKKYPSLDLSANGLPQYLYSENYNNNSLDTKTSQYKLNPSLNLRWDLIDPQRGPEIRSAKHSYEISRNNYNIKKKDLIKEAKFRFHKYQKSIENANNAQIAVDLSRVSLKEAQSKLDTGIGTKFDVLEAKSQLAKDNQILLEKNFNKEINLISLKEILNINLEEEISLKEEQKLSGYWNYSLEKNIKNGIYNSLSLRNLSLQGLIKENQAQNFKNANLPIIYLSNSLSSSFTKGSALSTTIDPDESSSSYTNKISINFSWNIFNGGQNKSSYKAKKAESAAEKFSYLNLKNIIKTDITETYLQLMKNKKKLLSTKLEISTSEESLRLTRLRYDVGIATLKDVLVRQKELNNARSKNVDAIHSYNLNLDKLERLTFLEKSRDCKSDDNIEKNEIYSICEY